MAHEEARGDGELSGVTKMKLFHFPENGAEPTLKCACKAQIPLSKPKFAFLDKLE